MHSNRILPKLLWWILKQYETLYSPLLFLYISIVLALSSEHENNSGTLKNDSFSLSAKLFPRQYTSRSTSQDKNLRTPDERLKEREQQGVCMRLFSFSLPSRVPCVVPKAALSASITPVVQANYPAERQLQIQWVGLSGWPSPSSYPHLRS